MAPPVSPRADKTARPATMQSIARATGVHVSTVARALDPAQRHRISPEVVERVQDEARRQHYRRDTVAASLRTGRTRLVGVVLPDLANPVFAPILGGVGEALAREGYSILMADGGGPEEERRRIVEELIARRVDGLILATAIRQDPVVAFCVEAGVPTVLVNRFEDTPRTSAVVTDDVGGMRLAVEHLVALGHRRIGHLAGPQSVSTGALRLTGFREAMKRAGLDASAVVEAPAYTRDAGEAATMQLLDAQPGLTAIAASNDLLALGAYSALASRGLSCPGDVSVVGHNDMPLVDMVEPPLTTIRIGHLAMGHEAARLLLKEMEQGSDVPGTHYVSAELVIRASTAPRPPT